MNITYRNYTNAGKLLNTNLKGAWKWAFSIILMNFILAFSTSFRSKGESAETFISFSTAILSTVLIIVLYSAYDRYVNCPNIISVYPISTKTFVKYEFMTLLTELLYLAIFAVILLTVNVFIGGNEFNLGYIKNLSGLAFNILECLIIVFALFPLAFVKNKVKWYISAFGILIVVGVANILLRKLAGIDNLFNDFSDSAYCSAILIVSAAILLVLIPVSYFTGQYLAKKNR